MYPKKILHRKNTALCWRRLEDTIVVKASDGATPAASRMPPEQTPREDHNVPSVKFFPTGV